MCMLTYYPAGNVPVDGKALLNGAELNRDGHGYAIVAGNRLIVRRGMDGPAMVDAFLMDRARHWRGPALFHSRLTTGGAVDKSNCHPFRFGGDRRTVVAHNGILPKDAQPNHKKDRRSDTRLAADEILPRRFGHLSDSFARDRLARWIGPWNKLVILTVNPAYPLRAYVINEKAGLWDDGVWYSNTDYQGWDSYRRYYSRQGGLYEEHCHYCGSMGVVDTDTGYCGTCTTCQDCLSVADECQCYLPRSDRAEYASEQYDREASDAEWERLAEAERDAYRDWWRDKIENLGMLDHVAKLDWKADAELTRQETRRV